MSNTNRNKGHDAERYYRNVFRELGYDKCITTRQGSRILDDCGVDLMHVPIHVQVKKGKYKNISYYKVLRYITDKLQEKFPEDDPVHDKLPICIHSLQGRPGKKRVSEDEVVFILMSELIKHYPKRSPELIVSKEHRKTRKGWTYSDRISDNNVLIHYKEEDPLVVMSFDTFVNYFLKKS